MSHLNGEDQMNYSFCEICGQAQVSNDLLYLPSNKQLYFLSYLKGLRFT